MEFEGFVKAELAGLTRFAGVLSGDRHLAHDVLIDALLVASRRWADIGFMGNPVAYVRRIVVTTFLAEHRKTARRRTFPSSHSDLPDVGRPDATGQVESRHLPDGLLRQLSQVVVVQIRGTLTAGGQNGASEVLLLILPIDATLPPGSMTTSDAINLERLGAVHQ